VEVNVKAMMKKLRMMNGENSEIDQVKNTEEMMLKHGAQILCGRATCSTDGDV